jgi:Putative MetA-pathway of phenol degradation
MRECCGLKAVPAVSRCRLFSVQKRSQGEMGNPFLVKVVVLGLLVILLSPAPSGAAEPKNEQKVQNWQVGFSPTYSSGNYGTSSTTNIIYLPLAVRRLFDNGDITFTIPYICIHGDGAVTVLSGVPNRVSKSGSSSSSTSPGNSGKSKNKQPGNVEPTSSTDCGIGDLILRGRYYLVDEVGWVPTIAVTGRIKFPTADSDRGLGTGRFDESFGVEVTKKLIGSWLGFVDFGYTFIGDPQDVNLRNQWYYDLGVGYNLTKNLLVSMYYEEYRALIEDLSNPRDLLFALNYKATSSLRFNASFLVGLSDGAPDYALTGGMSWRF